MTFNKKSTFIFSLTIPHVSKKKLFNFLCIQCPIISCTFKHRIFCSVISFLSIYSLQPIEHYPSIICFLFVFSTDLSLPSMIRPGLSGFLKSYFFCCIFSTDQTEQTWDMCVCVCFTETSRREFARIPTYRGKSE